MIRVRRLLLAGLACVPAVLFAQTTASQNPVAQTTPPPRKLRYRLVPDESTLGFELPTTFHVVHGKTSAWHGDVEVDPGTAGAMTGRIEIRADSIETGNAHRDLDVRDRVLEAAQHPQIVFELKNYKGNLARFASGATIDAEVDGDLTIHGVTKPIQASVECAVLPDHVVVAGAVPVFWKAFGLRDLSRMFLKIKDPMMVVFRFWGVPEQ